MPRLCARHFAAIVVCTLLGVRCVHGQNASAQPTPSTKNMQAMDHDDISGHDAGDEKAGEASAMHEMSGHHHHSGPHMKLTALRPQTPDDVDRAKLLVRELRDGIDKYKDYQLALADGYKIFLPKVPQKEYHFTNYRNKFLEAFAFDPTHPTSLLYRKTGSGYELVGAMYTMPRNTTEDKLNTRVPLSMAQWHLHTNLCLPPLDQASTADWTKFGLQGSISTKEACDAAGGKFHPVILGWMVHVYPYEASLEDIFAMHHDMH